MLNSNHWESSEVYVKAVAEMLNAKVRVNRSSVNDPWPAVDDSHTLSFEPCFEPDTGTWWVDCFVCYRNVTKGNTRGSTQIATIVASPDGLRVIPVFSYSGMPPHHNTFWVKICDPDCDGKIVEFLLNVDRLLIINHTCAIKSKYDQVWKFLDRAYSNIVRAFVIVSILCMLHCILTDRTSSGLFWTYAMVVGVAEFWYWKASTRNKWTE